MNGVPRRRLVRHALGCRGCAAAVAIAVGYARAVERAVRRSATVVAVAGSWSRGVVVLRSGGERWWWRWAAVGPHLQLAGPGLLERWHGALAVSVLLALSSCVRCTVRCSLVALGTGALALSAAALATATTVALLVAWRATRCGLTGSARGRWCSSALAALAWSSWSRWNARDESRWWRRRASVQVHLLEQQVGAGVGEVRERAMHLQDGDHMAELAVEAAKKSEDHLAIADGVAKLREGRSHGLQLATIVGDAHGVLAEIAELRLQEKGARLLLAKELIFEVRSRLTCPALLDHEGLLEVAGDGGEDPGEHDAVHLDPNGALGQRDVVEDVRG